MRILTTLDKTKTDMMKEMMAEDYITNQSVFIQLLIVAEYKRRKGLLRTETVTTTVKNPVGRPKKEKEDKTPKYRKGWAIMPNKLGKIEDGFFDGVVDWYMCRMPLVDTDGTKIWYDELDPGFDFKTLADILIAKPYLWEQVPEDEKGRMKKYYGFTEATPVYTINE